MIGAHINSLKGKFERKEPDGERNLELRSKRERWRRIRIELIYSM